MNIEKATSHLSYKFNNYKTIWVNGSDILAMNKIKDFIDNKATEKLNANIHFAKLYAFTLGYFSDRYQATFDDPIPHKELHKLLDKSFESIIYDITSKQNFQYQYKILEAAGCKLEAHPALMNLKDRKNLIDNLEKLIPLADNRKIFFGNAWTIEEIENGIKDQLKKFLNEQ